MAAEAVTMQLQLFRTSVLKQAKWRAIEALLEPRTDVRGLDLGADNGVLSYLLRQRGGAWCSADLDPKAVAAIRDLVHTDVYETDGRTLPFADGAFDVVVVIDLLEHIADDAGLVAELARVLRPGGRLIVNVPHIQRVSLLRQLRLRLGLTDAWHGHVRPGYTVGGLRQLLTTHFEVLTHRTYNRAFSELLDILLNYAYLRKTRGPAGGGKGTLVDAADLTRQQKLFRLYARLYPFMRTFTMLDVLLRPVPGYSLVVAAQKRAAPPPPPHADTRQ